MNLRNHKSILPFSGHIDEYSGLMTAQRKKKRRNSRPEQIRYNGIASFFTFLLQVDDSRFSSFFVGEF